MKALSLLRLGMASVPVTSADSTRPTVVLVHGAAADGSSWQKVIPHGKIPSWYIVSSEDRAINPELERFYAKRIGATTTEIKSSHAPFLPSQRSRESH